MKKFFTSLVLLAIFSVFMYSFYTEGYLDNTPLYDVIYTLSHLMDDKIASPVTEGEELMFYPEENVVIECSGETVYISGITGDSDKRNMIVRLEEDGEELAKEATQTDRDDTFSAAVKIPQTSADTIEVALYGNAREFGSFTSWVNDYVYFERVDGEWKMPEPIVYAHNTEMFTKPKAYAASLKSTRNIQSDNPVVKSTAKRITETCGTDYEKAVAIHDYICDNFRYDFDMAEEDIIAIKSATEILSTELGVCSGYANAYAALCRSVGLPCVVVTGYALGMSGDDTSWNEENSAINRANHAWNEVYVDGRWLIVDTTWDCGNSREDGEDKETGTSHLYFDANLKYFSVNHKILRYKDI